jgi:hypothetical protein
MGMQGRAVNLLRLTSGLIGFMMVVLSREALIQPSMTTIAEIWGAILGSFLLTWVILDLLVPRAEWKAIGMLFAHFILLTVFMFSGHVYALVVERPVTAGVYGGLDFFIINPRTAVYFGIVTATSSTYLTRILPRFGDAFERFSLKLESIPSFQSPVQWFVLLVRIAVWYFIVVLSLPLLRIDWTPTLLFEILPPAVAFCASLVLLPIGILERMRRRIYFPVDISSLLALAVTGYVLVSSVYQISQLMQLLLDYLTGLTWSSRSNLIWAVIFNGLAVAIAPELAFSWCKESVLAKIRRSTAPRTVGYVG